MLNKFQQGANPQNVVTALGKYKRRLKAKHAHKDALENVLLVALSIKRAMPKLIAAVDIELKLMHANLLLNDQQLMAIMDEVINEGDGVRVTEEEVDEGKDQKEVDNLVLDLELSETSNGEESVLDILTNGAGAQIALPPPFLFRATAPAGSEEQLQMTLTGQFPQRNMATEHVFSNSSGSEVDLSILQQPPLGPGQYLRWCFHIGKSTLQMSEAMIANHQRVAVTPAYPDFAGYCMSVFRERIDFEAFVESQAKTKEPFVMHHYTVHGISHYALCTIKTIGKENPNEVRIHIMNMVKRVSSRYSTVLISSLYLLDLSVLNDFLLPGVEPLRSVSYRLRKMRFEIGAFPVGVKIPTPITSKIVYREAVKNDQDLNSLKNRQGLLFTFESRTKALRVEGFWSLQYVDRAGRVIPPEESYAKVYLLSIYPIGGDVYVCVMPHAQKRPRNEPNAAAVSACETMSRIRRVDELMVSQNVSMSNAAVHLQVPQSTLSDWLKRRSQYPTSGMTAAMSRWDGLTLLPDAPVREPVPRPRLITPCADATNVRDDDDDELLGLLV